MFLTHLWKEWRDHRTLFLAQLTIVAVGSALLVWLTPYPDWQNVLGPEVLSLSAVTTLLLGGDLVAGEVRRGKHRLLARLPGALLHSFLAKLSALIISFFVVAVAGVLTALPVRYFVHEEAIDLWQSEPWLLPWPLLVGAFFIVAVWTLATSCWIRHGSLALPGALVLLALVAGPFVLIRRQHPHIEPLPFDMVAIPLAIGLAGLLGAFVSFTRGFRFGGGKAAAAWGVPLALLLCVPAWGLGYDRLGEWKTFDPAGAGFRIISAVLGEGGRYVFVTGNHSNGPWDYTPYHSALIDLHDGSWRTLDPEGTGGGWIHDMNREITGFSCQFTSQQRTVLFRASSPAPTRWDATTHILEGATGRVLARLGDASFQEHISALRRANTPLRLDGRRRAWFVDDRLEVEREVGKTASLPWDAEARPWQVHGQVFSYLSGKVANRQRRFYDLELGSTVETNGLEDRYGIHFRRGRWILEPLHPSVAPGPVLWDPSTGTFEQAQFLEAGDDVLEPLQDGRYLTLFPIDPRGQRRLGIVDPETGDRDGLCWENGEAALVTGARLYGLARTPDGLPILVLHWPDERAAYARLDARVGQVARGPRDTRFDVGRLIACFDEESALVITDNSSALTRIRFDGDPPETLFPR